MRRISRPESCDSEYFQFRLVKGDSIMKKRTVLALTFIFALAFAVILLTVASSQAQAQQSCKAFHAFAEEPTTNPFAPTDTWGVARLSQL